MYLKSFFLKTAKVYGDLSDSLDKNLFSFLVI